MYNGIGLLSVRGSGTSGHVQTNRFNLRHGPPNRHDDRALTEAQPTNKQPNKDIMDHNRKRALEVKLVQLRDELEESG